MCIVAYINKQTKESFRESNIYKAKLLYVLLVLIFTNKNTITIWCVWDVKVACTDRWEWFVSGWHVMTWFQIRWRLMTMIPNFSSRKKDWWNETRGAASAWCSDVIRYQSCLLSSPDKSGKGRRQWYCFCMEYEGPKIKQNWWGCWWSRIQMVWLMTIQSLPMVFVFDATLPLRVLREWSLAMCFLILI